MARVQPEIEQLIDEGLTRYGLGDLDGALESWEQALALDPEQDRARSYLDYVRNNYALLASEVRGRVEPPPFAIADEDPGYQIEVSIGDLVSAPAEPRSDDPLDGWAIEEDRPAGAPESRELTFSLEVDEPGAAGEGPLASFPPRPPEEPVNFEEATREYAGNPPRASQPVQTDDSVSQEFRLEIASNPGFEVELTPGFDSSSDLHTPAGFNTQITDVRPRDLGFVQPVAAAPPAAAAAPVAAPVPPVPPVPAPAPAPEPELLLRTPEGPPPEPAPLAPAGEAPMEASLELSYEVDLPTIERSPIPSDEPQPIPLPRPDEPARPKLPNIPAPRPASADAPGRRETRDFDAPTERKPLRPTLSEPLGPPNLRELAEPVTSRLPRTPTRPGAPPSPAEGKPPGVRPLHLPPPLVSVPLDPRLPIVTAPTRDLGLRQTQPALGGPPRVVEEDPTGETELHVPRAGVLPTAADTTRDDIVLPFDPIGARSAQILEAIDEQAPPDESHEDRTRRRITALFERAITWNKAGELDRAVAAIDLALSEDPNSALAQKLIHRHRETMMTVFQAFLGDLERTPVLARPLHELAAAPISPRAAFLLSRVDGLLSIDEILDVSGMPRLEAYRYLCQLFLRGILR